MGHRRERDKPVGEKKCTNREGGYLNRREEKIEERRDLAFTAGAEQMPLCREKGPVSDRRES